MNNQADKFVKEALMAGQNVLLSGTFKACWQWTRSLFALTPCSYTGPEVENIPTIWQHYAAALTNSEITIDFSANAPKQAQNILKSCASLVWIPAATISQALMRFEINSTTENAAMIVPAGFNLVVLIGQDGFIKEVNQIVLTEPAYKPCPVSFAQEAPRATAPIATPGQEVPEEDEPAENNAPIEDFPALGAEDFPAEDDDDYAAAEEAPLDPEDEQNFDPGWELEMMMANGAVKPQTNPLATSQESSALAATYRLAPPPKPLSMIEAEMAAKPGSVVLPPPTITPQTQAVIDSFERQFGPPPGANEATRRGPIQPRSFQQVFAERQRRK